MPNPFSRAWTAFRGRAAPGVIFGDPAAEQALGGLLAGAVPFGSPPKRGERELMVAGKKHPIVRSIISRIGGDIAATPWQLFRANNEQGQAEKRWPMIRGTAAQRKGYRTVRKTGQLRNDVQEITDHPCLTLLHHQFNPIMSALDGHKIVQKYLELKGEAFLGIERNALGVPCQLWPIPGYWIFRTPYHGSPVFQANWGTWIADIPERDVIWLRDLDPEQPYMRGAGVGESLGDEIEIDEYAAKTQKALFYNHGVPAAIVSLQGANQAEIDRAKENFNQKYGGIWNAAKMFWTGTEMDVKQLALDFVDSDIGQLRKDERDKIIQMWGLPPELLGINENSNRATISEAKSIYAERVLLPRLEFLRTSYQARLIPEFDDRLILDFVDPSPDDQAFKLQVASAAPWSRSKNEWRELGGLGPLDGGDDVFPPMPAAAPPPANTESTKPVAGEPPMPKGFEDPAWVKSLPPGFVFERKDRLGDCETHTMVRAAKDYHSVEDLIGALHDEDVTSPMEALYSDELKKWMAKVADQTGLDVDFAQVNPKIAEYIRQRSLDKVRGLAKANDTTRDQLRASLAEGIDAGEAIPKLAARVRGVFEDAQGYRSTLIARTETTRAAGWGNVTAFKAGGAEAKEWVATQDDGTRDDHADMDGQVVGIDDDFEAPGGETAGHPGDFDDPQEDCGCRCTISTAEKSEIDGDDEKAMRSRRKKTLERRDAAWKLFDATVTPWEDRAKATLIKGFAKQRAAVLAALGA